MIREYLDSIIESSTPHKPIWNVELKYDDKSPHWNYIDGCMMKAILDVYYVTLDEKYLSFVTNYMDFFIDENGEILGFKKEDYNCDNINEGKVLFDLYEFTKKDKYRKAIDLLYDQLKTHPRTQAGSFWHKNIYKNQVWLDGLYMVQPFYMRYEKEYNNNENYRDVFKQFKNVNDLMKDEKTGLFYHGYDEKKESFWADRETGCSKNFWTRSLAWYGMALLDTIEYIDEQLFYEYMTLQQYFKDLMDSILKFQDRRSKMFYQVTDMIGEKGNYLETSGTCAIAYCLMKGARLEYLPCYYFDMGKEIFESVLKNKFVSIKGSFCLKDICLVAGLGGMPGKGNYKVRDGSYEYYISEPKVDNDGKGIAAFLFSFKEQISSFN